MPSVRVVSRLQRPQDRLLRPGNVVVERTFALSRGVDALAIRKLVTGFATGELGTRLANAQDRRAKEIRSGLIGGVRSVFSLTDDDGKYSYPSLEELERHLGRGRVRIFAVDLDGRLNWEKLRVRSDGTEVKVRASAFGREEARGKAVESVEEAVLLLGLVAPSDAPARARPAPTMRYDAFISHASEDADSVATPLRNALKKRGYRIWLDRFVLKVGDSLRRSIDEGLLRSRHGIVVLSPKFFAKRKVWTANELDGLFSREQVIKRRTILPVVHNMTTRELALRSPMLAGRLAASTADGIETVASELVAAMGAPLTRRTPRRPPTASVRGARRVHPRPRAASSG